mmetsp:Transcript_44459/g.128486  ORF Transcript_44459/g.128486 Transcript_44459/m.128486 type:complete len:249 (+) Transcript_44459:126-872(+)
MTDRFYPLGLPHEPDAWKTTYETQNEMKTHARSAYPPGTAVHLPGARETFGFSSPGPIRSRMAQGHLHPTDAVDVPNPRESHARLRMHEDNERAMFERHDIDEMARSYRSPVLAATTGSFRVGNKTAGGFASSMRKTKSTGALTMSAPQRVSSPPEHAHALEDDHFHYFVPKAQQKGGHARLNPHMLSKLHKADRISFPFSGEGTGFRSQGGSVGVFPEGTYEGITTSSRTNFSHPASKRISPLDRMA